MPYNPDNFIYRQLRDPNPSGCQLMDCLTFEYSGFFNNETQHILKQVNPQSRITIVIGYEKGLCMWPL